MCTSLDEARTSIIESATQALKDGLLVTPDIFDRHDGQHPESLRDLDTPASFAAGLLEAWTVDMEFSDDEKAQIEALIHETLSQQLPEALRGHL